MISIKQKERFTLGYHNLARKDRNKMLFAIASLTGFSHNTTTDQSTTDGGDFELPCSRCYAVSFKYKRLKILCHIGNQLIIIRIKQFKANLAANRLLHLIDNLCRNRYLIPHPEKSWQIRNNHQRFTCNHFLA